MRKILTLVGTRPELIKMSPVIKHFDEFTDHLLVHSGQNYDHGLRDVFFNDLDIRLPDIYLDCYGSNPCEFIASVIDKSFSLFLRESPDAVLLYGDTNSCLSVIAAKRLKIPVFHFEAGNRCFDERVPEELNRKVVDHLSDINFVLTEHARRYLIAEGIKPDTIFKTGSHMPQIIFNQKTKILSSNILANLNLLPYKYILVSAHREENVDIPANLNHLIDSLQSLANKYSLPIIVSTHPRTKSRLDSLAVKNLNPLIQFHQPFAFSDYMKLQINSFCVLSDSGTLTEEASILHFPAVMIRSCHERPEGFDEGVLIMSGLRSPEIIDAVNICISNRFDPESILNDYYPTRDQLVTDKILKSVCSYIDFINKTVWKKSV